MAATGSPRRTQPDTKLAQVYGGGSGSTGGSFTDRPNTCPAGAQRDDAATGGCSTAREPRRPPSESPIKESKTPRSTREWVAHTHERLLSVRALRKELMQAKDGGAAFLESSQMSSGPSKSLVGGAAIDKIKNGALLEDRLKKRQANEKNLAAELTKRMESMEHAIYAVGQCMSELQRQMGFLWAQTSVVEKRLELRAARPAQELVEDAFQEALESERTELLRAHEQLSKQMQACKEMRDAVDRAKAEMLQHKLTLHLDRTSWPMEFLGKTKDLEQVATQFCSRCNAAIRTAEGVASRSRERTHACMTRRISELHEMRKHLDGEITETRCAIADAKMDLERIAKKLKAKNAEPERVNEDQDVASELEAANFTSTTVDNGALARVRQKIKGAAYTGTNGRQLDVIFSRFDRDNSGELDEDEVRLALRRTLRIAPSVVSDAEISCLCNTLDADGSGSVSIDEIVAFLNADCDVTALEDQYHRINDSLERLNTAQELLVLDLRNKTAAWKIDRSCLLVTPIKGLELDALPPPLKPGKEVGKRVKPLEPRVVDKVKLKIQKAAVAVGGKLDELLGRFDRNGVGRLEVTELRRALRGPLKIPSFAVSDAEIKSLCAMLDLDNLGAVSIEDVVGFVGSEEKGSRSPRTSLKAAQARESPASPSSAAVQLHPIKTVEQGGAAKAGGPNGSPSGRPPGSSQGSRNRWPGA